MKKLQRKRVEWVSASKAGRAAFCPHYLEQENQQKKVSSHALKSRYRGDVEHKKLNKKAQDTRCYIASELYGVNDRRTQLLRDYRDGRLLVTASGRLAVSIYYKISPSVVMLARQYPSVNTILGWLVNRVINNINK